MILYSIYVYATWLLLICYEFKDEFAVSFSLIAAIQLCIVHLNITATTMCGTCLQVLTCNKITIHAVSYWYCKSVLNMWLYRAVIHD